MLEKMSGIQKTQKTKKCCDSKNHWSSKTHTPFGVQKKKSQSQHRKKHTKLLGLSGNPSQVLDWMDKSCKLEGHSHLMMQAQGPPDFMMKLFQNVEKNNKKNTNNKKKARITGLDLSSSNKA